MPPPRVVGGVKIEWWNTKLRRRKHCSTVMWPLAVTSVIYNKTANAQKQVK